MVLRRFSPEGIFRYHYFEYFRNFCEDKHDEVKLKKRNLLSMHKFHQLQLGLCIHLQL